MTKTSTWESAVTAGIIALSALANLALVSATRLHLNENIPAARDRSSSEGVVETGTPEGDEDRARKAREAAEARKAAADEEARKAVADEVEAALKADDAEKAAADAALKAAADDAEKAAREAALKAALKAAADAALKAARKPVVEVPATPVESDIPSGLPVAYVDPFEAPTDDPFEEFPIDVGTQTATLRLNSPRRSAQLEEIRAQKQQKERQALADDQRKANSPWFEELMKNPRGDQVRDLRRTARY